MRETYLLQGDVEWSSLLPQFPVFSGSSYAPYKTRGAGIFGFYFRKLFSILKNKENKENNENIFGFLFFFFLF